MFVHWAQLGHYCSSAGILRKPDIGRPLTMESFVLFVGTCIPQSSISRFHLMTVGQTASTRGQHQH